MSEVDINIFQIAKTQVDKKEVEKWLIHLGVNWEKFEIPEDISDPALLIALSAKRCYMSFEAGLNKNVTKVRKDYVDYFDNILTSKHGSVLEHSIYSFAIEGLSRVCTGELNRHKTGWAISEGSLRFIRFDKDIPYWLPTSLQPNSADDPDLASRKQDTRAAFTNVFNHAQEVYAELLAIWDMEEGSHNFDYKKKVTSCLRRIIPLGVATGGVWTGNIRALRHVIAMRTSAAAEEEIFHVFSRIAEMMVEQEPLLFGDFHKLPSGEWKPDNWKV